MCLCIIHSASTVEGCHKTITQHNFLPCVACSEGRPDLSPIPYTLKHFALATPTGQPRGDAPNPGPSWLVDRSWRQLRLLSALPTFHGLDAAVSATPTEWQAVYDAPEPQNAPLPGLFASLDPFRRLCVLRCGGSEATLVPRVLRCTPGYSMLGDVAQRRRNTPSIRSAAPEFTTAAAACTPVYRTCLRPATMSSSHSFSLSLHLRLRL
jgi:hypothetical protein